MNNIYCTADEIGTPTGGGIVTKQESDALKTLGETVIIGRHQLSPEVFGMQPTPFAYDYIADALVLQILRNKFDLAHFYSGTFSKTVFRLRNAGVKVCYTLAAHDLNESIKEFRLLNIPYNFPHMTNPLLWSVYIEGFLAADLIICPSTHSKKFVESFGCKNVKVIPHGVDIPEKVAPLPREFSAGYLGQLGPDKGILYLLLGWRDFGWYGAEKLKFAGNQSLQIKNIFSTLIGPNIETLGFVPSISDLFNSCSVYVQPSVTEGFGIEVLEAMAHGRPVIVSDGAGASDVVTEGVDGFIVPARDWKAISNKLKFFRDNPGNLYNMGMMAKKKAMNYTWDKVRNMYVEAWRNLVPESRG